MLDLILALQNLPAARLLPSPNGRGTLLSDLLRIATSVDLDDFEIRFVACLLKDVVNNKAKTKIWNTVKDFVTQSTLPLYLLPNCNQTL